MKRSRVNPLEIARADLLAAADDVSDALAETRPFYRMAKLAGAAERIGSAMAVIGKAMLVQNYETAAPLLAK